MIRLECENEDSCDLGTAHDFPEIDDRVMLDPDVSYRILGTGREADLAGPLFGRVSAHVEHAHMVLVELRDHNITVYADIEDDILP